MNFFKKISAKIGNNPIIGVTLTVVGLLFFLVYIVNHNPRREAEIESAEYIQVDNKIFIKFRLTPLKINNRVISTILVPSNELRNCRSIIELLFFRKEGVAYFLRLPREIRLVKEGSHLVLRASPEIKTVKKPAVSGEPLETGGC